MKKSAKRILSLYLTLALLVSACIPAYAADDDKVLQIISFNDFHGALAEGSKDMGWAKMVGAVNALRAENANTLVVSAGDNFQGTAMSNLTYGEPVNAMLKDMGVVASAVGNHEFDWGPDRFEEWASAGGYDFIASNIYDKITGQPVTWAVPYKIVTVDDVKIALIGIATPETLTKTKAAHVANLEFKDPAVAAQTWIDYLESGEASEGRPDVIIALTHLGAYQESNGTDPAVAVTGTDIENLCNNTTGLDAVITGHSHTTVAGYANDIPVVQAGKQGRGLASLAITTDSNGTLIDIIPSFTDYTTIKDTVVPDPAAAAAYEIYNTALSPILDEKIGVAAGDFPHDNLTNVSVLGRFVCEAMAKATNTQIALQNGGGLRVDVPTGDITVGSMYTVMPFDNTLVTMEMTGADILKAVEHGLFLPTAGYGSFSGLKITYDDQAEYGSMIISIALSDGTPLDMAKTYSVVTNDFMLTGGDGYDFSGATNVVDTYIPIRDMLVDTIKAAGTITPQTVDYLMIATSDSVEIIPPVVKPVEEVYIIVTGDTLWAISRKYGLTYQELGTYNNIKNFNLIFPGQKLTIPAN